MGSHSQLSLTSHASLRADPGLSGKGRTDLIYKTLFDAILAQQLTPNTKLSEETIGGFFGVSRTVVRAVLNQLKSVSLVELRQNRGAFVVSPSVEESLQVFQARICIEQEICACLPAVITSNDILALRAHLEKEHAAHQKGDSINAIILSGEFHMVMARLAGNGVLVRFLHELISRTSLILSAHAHRTAPKCGLDEHLEIVDALEARDGKRLKVAMRRHLEGIIETTNLTTPEKPEPKLEDILSTFSKKI